MVLMISYDLNGHEPAKVYEDVKNFIEENATSWARPLKSQWFVETSRSPEWWNSQLMKVINSNDRLFVCRIYSNAMAYPQDTSYQGYLGNEIWAWLNPRV